MGALLASVAMVLAASNASAQRDPRRDPAYYRGRPRRVTAGEALAWIPRVLLAPLYVVVQGLRLPIRALIAAGEQSHAIARVDRAMHPSPDVDWTPTITVDLGLLTTVGLQARVGNVLARGNEVRVGLATGGESVWHLAGEDAVTHGAFRAGVRAGFLTRPDRVFYGLGPEARAQDKSFYTLSRGEAWAFASYAPSNHVAVRSAVGYRAEITGPGLHPSIDTVFQTASLAGYGGYPLALVTTGLALDTRRTPYEGTGAHLDVRGTLAQDPRDTERRFAQYEADLTGAVEVVHPGRVLSASLYVADTAPLGHEPVPFTSLVMLGGARMPGFYYGRYADDAAAVLSMDFRYPLWTHFDGFLTSAVGNVFDHLDRLDVRQFAGSLGLGFRTHFEQRTPLEILVALGTTRFDERFGVEGVRVFAKIDQGL